jgi:hypothetical protein
MPASKIALSRSVKSFGKYLLAMSSTFPMGQHLHVC